MTALRVGLPKGRGLEYTRRACVRLNMEIDERMYRYESPAGFVLYLLKFGDIARLLAAGTLDLGITGEEWLLEAEDPCEPIPRLTSVPIYAARLCLLQPAGARIPYRIGLVASPFPRLAARLVADLMPVPEIMSIDGTSEALVPDLADAAVDVVETGETAKRHGLAVARDYGAVGTTLANSRAFNPARAGSLIAALAGAD